MPFDQLVDALRPTRVAGETPLFQVLFNHQSLPARHDWRVADLVCQPVAMAAPMLPFELQCDSVEYDDGNVQFTLRYARDVLSRALVERMADAYEALLRELARAPDAAVPVSYTHLDVYKRQAGTRDECGAGGARRVPAALRGLG